MNQLTTVFRFDSVLARARVAALGVVAIAPMLGCGSDVGSTDPAAEETASASEALRCTVPDDPPASSVLSATEAVAAADCGAQSTTPCRVVTAFSGTFTNLQSAINGAINGDVLTVTGHCAGATVTNRIGLTITGPQPLSGCGFYGPTPTQLGGTVNGLTVRGSTNISVRFLNLVNATNGLLMDRSTTSSASCNCAAFNSGAGVSLTNTQANTVSQILAQSNAVGISGNNTATVIFSNSTVRGNTQAGILLQNSSNDIVSSNIVVNNPGLGVSFVNVRMTLASANVINGNGDGLVNLINCSNSQATGNNVPRNCR